MKRISCLASAAVFALALSATASAAPAAGGGRPPELTAGRGLVQVEIRGASKAEVERTAQSAADLTAINASLACWQAHWRFDRGHFFFSREVNQQTLWCGDGRAITYRSTETWPHTGALCSVMWGPASWRSGGGVGAWYVDVTSRGGFACWLYYGEYRDWIEFTVRFTASGFTYSV